ncbi:hypothetical protein [Streptomyces sp. NPDC014685]|uniref:hypothetical protein n=1 Tax=Streptomyces sp. NPDC014685 TaxID=3364881 RepID=UPI0036F79D44
MTDRMSILSAGLRWLYGTEQPAESLLSHHGETLADTDRTYRFVPRGADQRPVVVVDVRRPTWTVDAVGDMVPANPIGHRELVEMQADLAVLGVTVAHTWNGYPAHTGSLGLVDTAHPSLLAAVDRVRAGCPDHPGKLLCDWIGCPWYGTGHARIVRPTVLGKDTCGRAPRMGESTPAPRPTLRAAGFLTGARNGRALAGGQR